MARTRTDKTSRPSCPCGNGHFAACCGPLLARDAHADSAEQLMRSRYSAYVKGDASYLLDTWHPSTRPPELDLAGAPERWIGLQLRSSRTLSATLAEVEFLARYRIGGRAHRLHETSRFERVDGRWYYLEGDLHET